MPLTFTEAVCVVAIGVAAMQFPRRDAPQELAAQRSPLPGPRAGLADGHQYNGRAPSGALFKSTSTDGRTPQ